MSAISVRKWTIEQQRGVGVFEIKDREDIKEHTVQKPAAF
jgi:hypothetical protein